MIKRLRVKNFRSLKDVDLDVRINNVLVGANASGKSNIIDVFKFLTQLALGGLSRAFVDRLGYPEVVWKGRDAGPIHVVLNVETAEAERKYELEYEIEVDGSPVGLLTLRRERLTLQSYGTEVHLIDFSLGHGSARYANGNKAFDSPGNPSQSALEFNVPGWEGTRFKEYLSRWQFHRLDPLRMMQVNPAGRAAFLTETGDNLAAWLATLKTSHSDYFRRIELAAKDAFEGLVEILTELTQFQTTFLSSRDKYLSRPVPVWGLSGGELCFIALASLILGPPEMGAPLHCVEEVENHLNPRLIETLVTLLKQWQAVYLKQGNAAQIIITTHSPYVVDQFELEDLVVVEKRSAETRALRPSDKEHLRKLLVDQERGLGDLWYSGALGGV